MTDYQKAKRKLQLELVIMAPFVWMGKLAGHLFPLRTSNRIFLFFPNADIGGTPKVNAEIAGLLKHEHPLIIFSKKAQNNQYLQQYKNTGGRYLNLHRYIDHKAFHFVNFFFRGVLASWINKQENAIVFGGESIFFYKVIPHLKPGVRCIELTHVDRWLPYTIAFADRLDARIFSTRKGMEKAVKQYRENNIPASLDQKLFFVDNCIPIPNYEEKLNEQLQVFFIGRGAAQKRVHLAAAIAKACVEKALPVTFNFVGDVDKVIDVKEYPYCHFFGMVKDEEKMASFYQQADMLLMTSSFEGLPLVVMQMMAHGKVVLSTAVNGIPDYIEHMQNGLLIRATAEDEIIKEGVFYIEQMVSNEALLKELGANARKDAVELFSSQQFEKKYRQIFGL